MDSRRIFTKPPIKPSEQVSLLSSRGMHIVDPVFAERHLARVNYYRFCGYALHYELFEKGKRTHRYKRDASFADVCGLCEFDSKLRTLLFAAIEHIEVAFRTAMCLEMSLRHRDSHWYLKPSRFCSSFEHDKLLEHARFEVQRSREVFVSSYKKKYSKPDLPPGWMLTEILSLGKWSKMYGALINLDDQKAIAYRLGAKHRYVKSWMHALSFLRNLCAHHARIWNRVYSISPKLTPSQKHSVSDHTRVAAFCAVIADMLSRLGRARSFKEDLQGLLAEYPHVPLSKMGFAPDWLSTPTWK